MSVYEPTEDHAYWITPTMVPTFPVPYVFDTVATIDGDGIDGERDVTITVDKTRRPYEWHAEWVERELGPELLGQRVTIVAPEGTGVALVQSAWMPVSPDEVHIEAAGHGAWVAAQSS